jgi:multiple antibiotic resistance protein
VYGLREQAMVAAVMLAVIACTIAILAFAQALQRRIGDTGIVVISKVMGLILAAFAAQSILSGIKGYFGL